MLHLVKYITKVSLIYYHINQDNDDDIINKQGDKIFGLDDT